jgi:hypothetical protein
MLDRTTYFIHEHVGMFKLTDVYDILDSDTQAKIGEAREEISSLSKLALGRFDGKDCLPLVQPRTSDGAGQVGQPLSFVLAGAGERVLRGQGVALRVGQSLGGVADGPLCHLHFVGDVDGCPATGSSCRAGLLPRLAQAAEDHLRRDRGADRTGEGCREEGYRTCGDDGGLA